MTELDLFVMARGNTEHLASECEGHTGAMLEFAESVIQQGRLSVTMRFERLRDFLEGGRYLNPWEECSRDSGGDEARAQQLMQERQREYYGKRALFDGSFLGGKKFRYGALYTGGRALIDSKYGPFSAIFSMNVAASWKLIAWLPENSLKRYVPDEHTLRVDQLKCEVGEHGSRHHVAAIKHAGDVVTCSRDEWPNMLCHGDRFIEGIVAEELIPAAVERILMDTMLWTTLQDAADAVLDGDDVDDQTRADADRFKELRVGLTSRDLAEEMV
jgi:hypothetical protein